MIPAQARGPALVTPYLTWPTGGVVAAGMSTSQRSSEFLRLGGTLKSYLLVPGLQQELWAHFPPASSLLPTHAEIKGGGF